MAKKIEITEEIRKMAIKKGIPESDFNMPFCLQYIQNCIDSEKDNNTTFFDDRAEVNDDNTYYDDVRV